MKDYNSEVERYDLLPSKPESVDEFVDYSKLDWSSTLKDHLKRNRLANYDPVHFRTSLYRPFTKKLLFYAKPLIDRPGKHSSFLPGKSTEAENRVICHTDKGSEKPFMTLMSQQIPDLHVVGPGASAQCFPFYTYDEDGSNRRENITDWALDRFRSHYSAPDISKWDIFYYVYGLLHHPGYRNRYAVDLKRYLLRVPLAPSFRTYSVAGAKLAELHLGYESVDRYPLDWEPTRDHTDDRVEKMLLRGKVDSEQGNYKVYSTLKYNETLTLHGIPERAFTYRLGDRSAIEWIVDQYHTNPQRRSGITHDPNGYSDDPQYILHLIERVITVSLRTVDIVEDLAKLPFRPDSGD